MSEFSLQVAKCDLCRLTATRSILRDLSLEALRKIEQMDTLILQCFPFLGFLFL